MHGGCGLQCGIHFPRGKPFQAGAVEDLIRCLRSCRCDTLEQIHEKQKQLDRLDMLIRDAKTM